MDVAKHKDDRVSIRLDAEQKAIIDRAAGIIGTSRSSFVLSNAVEAAAKVIEQRNQIVLSERGWDAFCSLVTEDSEPSQAAVAAARTYRGR